MELSIPVPVPELPNVIPAHLWVTPMDHIVLEQLPTHIDETSVRAFCTGPLGLHLYALLRFITGIGAIGSFMVCFVLAVEHVGYKVVQPVQSFFENFYVFFFLVHNAYRDCD